MGERTSIQDGAIIHAVEEYPTVIGDDCVVGHLAHLEGCVIEDRALVGSGSIVLHEATVRSGATVGAGAVVRNRMDVPANALAVGVPAIIKLDASTKAPSWRTPPPTSPTPTGTRRNCERSRRLLNNSAH